MSFYIKAAVVFYVAALFMFTTRAALAGNADLTDDDKRAAAPIEDAIADLEYNLREVMHDRIQDAALFIVAAPYLGRIA